MKNRFRYDCSCCGFQIIKKEFEDNIIPEDNKDVEGNLCASCYYEQLRQNWYQIKDMIQLVYNAIKRPVEKFKFKHKTFEEQYYICNVLLKKGILKWQIG